jgi:hypothetical protein
MGTDGAAIITTRIREYNPAVLPEFLADAYLRVMSS